MRQCSENKQKKKKCKRIIKDNHGKKENITKIKMMKKSGNIRGGLFPKLSACPSFLRIYNILWIVLKQKPKHSRVRLTPPGRAQNTNVK